MDAQIPTPAPNRRWIRLSLKWMLIGVVVVIAATVAILVLTSTIPYWVAWVGDEQGGTSIIIYFDGTTLVQGHLVKPAWAVWLFIIPLVANLLIWSVGGYALWRWWRRRSASH